MHNIVDMLLQVTFVTWMETQKKDPYGDGVMSGYRTTMSVAYLESSSFFRRVTALWQLSLKTQSPR